MNKFLQLAFFSSLVIILNVSLLKADCRKDTIMYYRFDLSTSNKILTARLISNYNDQSSLIDQVNQIWNNDTNSWNNVSRTSNVYDANIVSEILSQEWDNTNNNWVNTFISKYTYYPSNTEVLKQEWDDNALDWLNYRKSTFVYNSNLDLVEYISQSWTTNNTWENKNKYSFSYTSSNKASEDLYQYWDSTANEWVNYSKSVYQYDASDKSLVDSELDWDSSVNDWVFYSNTYYLYNTQGNLSEDINKVWDENANTFVNNSRNSYTYDVSNKLTGELSQDWYETSNAWINNRNTIYEYETNENLIATDFFDVWNETENIYLSHTREEYICNSIINSTLLLNNNQVLIYPNPVSSEYINVIASSNENYKLIDLAGKVINYGKVEAGKNLLSLDKVNINGIYILKIGGISHKIVIEK